MMKSFASAGLIVAVMGTDVALAGDDDNFCCKVCDVEGQVKYQSVDTQHNMCGECCMDPKDFKLYHFFEKNLELSNSTTPCLDLGFADYSETVTHGAFDVKMTLDLYGPTTFAADEPCCNVCEVEGQVKYLSVDKMHNMCGECCMDPNDFKLYHLFEKNLELASSPSPCLDLGFDDYTQTVTHGAFNIKMTLDLYGPSKDIVVVEDEPCCNVCEVEGQEKYLSIVTFPAPSCGECCMAPKDYKLFHKFEKNLVKANSTTPCLDAGYGAYEETVTHGAFNIKMTLDMYGPDGGDAADATVKVLTNNYKSKASSGDDIKCPGSPAKIHAWAKQTSTFATSCDVVATEIKARVNGQYASWHDPHNNGTYSILSSDASTIELKRVTGNGKYTDRITVTLSGDSNSCNLAACSESQVTSVKDFSTNFCNARVLYCGSDDTCKTVGTDLESTRPVVTTSFGAGKDLRACFGN